MKRKKIALLAASGLLVLGCLTACGDTQEKVEIAGPEVIEEPVVKEPEVVEPPKEEEEPEEPATNGDVIEDRTVVNGEIQSYLTGEWTSEEIANRRPIAVMVPNNRPAMPQYGLSLAGVIYEAPVEGRITRLMPIFENYDELERIGPVRSSRDYYVYTAMGFEAIYCNWGLAVPYVEELINRDTVYNVSAAVEGIHNPADEAFYRVSRGDGYALEFTGYLKIEGMKKAVDRLGYDWNYDELHVRPFLFANDQIKDYPDNESATMIYPGGKSGNNSSGYGAYHPYFEYHEDDHLYYRYQDGKKQIDEYNNEQLAVTNVIFQYCHGEVRDAHDYLAFQVHSPEDTAIIFTNGKVIKGTWSRSADFEPPVYYDENGEEVVLNQGKTWICNIWKEYSEYVEYE